MDICDLSTKPSTITHRQLQQVCPIISWFLKIWNIFVLLLDTKIKNSNYQASSLKRRMFQHAIVQQTLKYIPMTYTIPSDLNLVWDDFEEFYNMMKSNNILESHVNLLYLNLTYFLQSWFNQKTQGCTFCKARSNTS